MIYSICQISLCAIPVYINLYAIEKLFNQKKYFLYGFCLIGTIVISSIFIESFFSLVFNDTYSLHNYIFEITWFVIITSTIKVGLNSIKQRLDLEKMKTKQLETELSLLKTQINPHFLFNTLNNLYGLAQKQKMGTADGIAQLSDLMRYMIYDSGVSKIDLAKEIHQIRQLIKLQKLRFSIEDDLSIDFQIEGDVNAVKIPPMLLIPFVENAFKHGISCYEPSFLKIDLRIDESKLHLSVKNSIHISRNPQSDLDSGLGLKNVRRRLELLYPDSHELKIRKEEKNFEIDLSLNL
jgi:LytS/YehU family sensor histidine kinase